MVRDVTDDDSGGRYEGTSHHHPLAGPKCPVCARNVTRIARDEDSEEQRSVGEPVVIQAVVPTKEGAANLIDDCADQQCEEEVAEDLVNPRKPCGVADKVLLNGGHSDHDLVNQR